MIMTDIFSPIMKPLSPAKELKANKEIRRVQRARVAQLEALNAELLEALQELLKFPSGQYSTSNGFDEACLKAEAAIAKATS